MLTLLQSTPSFHVIKEFSFEEIFAPVNLEIGKCRMSVAEPIKLAVLITLKVGVMSRVATKYPKITKNYFAKGSTGRVFEAKRSIRNCSHAWTN